ncbi:MAG: YggT family protein [Candidatus Obscuribacter sp.]|nr:YggT family protein [Candidatus Melainabacteria bacterium]MDX1988529.1 YggT family protein [Candidatus Obscuribacter sp.]
MNPIIQIIDGVISIFSMALILWCLLTWFPNINWYDQPWRTLDKIVRPVLAPVKKVIPPIGNIDISAMVLAVALGFIRNILHALF